MKGDQEAQMNIPVVPLNHLQLVWETDKHIWLKNSKVSILQFEHIVVTTTKTTEMHTLCYITSTDKQVLYQNLVNVEILMRLPQTTWESEEVEKVVL